MARRDQIMEYVTEQTSLTHNDRITRALEGRLFDELNTEETVKVLLNAVKALYHVNLWLADELDKITPTPAAQ